MGAGGDRKVTPGVTGSSRARAPIDPAVWYLGPSGPWGRIVVTRLKYPQKNTSIGLYRRNPTSFIQDVREDALGRAGEGNAEGSPTGFQHPIRWKINRTSNGLLPYQRGSSEVKITHTMNRVPAATFVKLAGRAVYLRRGLTAFVGGAPAVCTAHHKLHFRRQCQIQA